MMWSLKAITWSVLASFATTTFAANISKVCSPDNVCLSINIPDNSQDTYCQITAPSSAGWAGAGIGSGMKGALMFVIYPNADGSALTISPRLGLGHIMPMYDSSINIKQISGSGIKDNSMIANFVCTNCRSWSGGKIDVTSTKQSFIWAIGSSQNVIKSNSVSATIQQHDNSGVFSLNLVKATGGNGGDNVFSSGSSNPSSTGSTSGSDTTSTGTGTGTGTGTSTDSGTVYSTTSSKSGGISLLTTMDKVIFAHALIMSITWLFLFPLGATIIRFLKTILPNPVVLHWALQLTNYVLVLIAFSLGVYYSNSNLTNFIYFHQYFGTVIVSLLLVQIMLGYVHHRNFKKYKRRTAYSHGHIWFGRLLVVCAIVNGGLGFELVDTPRKFIVAYAVVAALVGVSYAVACGILILGRRRSSGASGASSEEGKLEREIRY